MDNEQTTSRPGRGGGISITTHTPTPPTPPRGQEVPEDGASPRPLARGPPASPQHHASTNTAALRSARAERPRHTAIPKAASTSHKRNCFTKPSHTPLSSSAFACRCNPPNQSCYLVRKKSGSAAVSFSGTKLSARLSASLISRAGRARRASPRLAVASELPDCDAMIHHLTPST